MFFILNIFIPAINNKVYLELNDFELKDNNYKKTIPWNEIEEIRFVSMNRSIKALGVIRDKTNSSPSTLWQRINSINAFFYGVSDLIPLNFVEGNAQDIYNQVNDFFLKLKPIILNPK